MAEFLVAPPEPIARSVTVEDFAKAVTRRWPDAGVRGWGEGAHLAASAWVRRPEAWDDILIELHPNRNIIGIDVRSPEATAEIACWWRRLAPSDIAVLWLFDRSFAGYTEIRPDTVRSDVFGNSTTG